MTYSKKFKNIKEETILSVKTCVKSGLFKVEQDQQLALLRILNHELSVIYNIDEPTLNFVAEASKGNGLYIPNVITLYQKPSLVTFLHEFRHHMQFKMDVHKGSEEDARGWSLSVFRKACPVSYKKAAEEGKLYYK